MFAPIVRRTPQSRTNPPGPGFTHLRYPVPSVMLIVTIDGPSGTGKSTVSKAAATAMSLPYLDTGAFYRAATLAVIRSQVDPSDAASVLSVVSEATFDQRDGITYLDGEEVSEEIRTDRITRAVSEVSAYPVVRQRLVELQRSWVDQVGGSAVVEGRDIGSVVFPAAQVKVYLDARPEVRAARRAAQAGEDPTETSVDLLRRDQADSTRSASPLIVPSGAHVIDTSDLTFEEVVDTVVRLVDSKS